ncbi:hypothetical protein [Marinithermofilum abyssi]|nr:hypothetical protein [Marinithermofilum abyssi]
MEKRQDCGGAAVDEVEVYRGFGGYLPARIGAEEPGHKGTG